MSSLHYPLVLKSSYARFMNARYLFMFSGLFFSLVILCVSIFFVEYEKEEGLDAASEHGRLYTGGLENHVSEVLTAIDKTINLTGQGLDLSMADSLRAGRPESISQLNRLIESAVINSTRLRSLTILNDRGDVILSSNQQVLTTHLNLAELGFPDTLSNELVPGRLQFVRDIHELMSDKLSAASTQIPGVSSIPFARSMLLSGKRVIVLAMVSPESLLPEYSTTSGAQLGYAAIFDYQGNLLASTGNSGFSFQHNYLELPMFALLQKDVDFGQFKLDLSSPGNRPDRYIVNFRATRKFPLVAITGMSESRVIDLWSAGPGAFLWLGLIAAGIVLLYTKTLWRVMASRETVELALKIAKDAAEKANASRGEFLSIMSHEIRTPMNAVIGMAGLLRETPLDAQQEEFTTIIESSADSLMAIINDILDFSKIDAGRLVIEKIDCHLLSIVESSVDVLSIRAREKGLNLMSFIDPALPPVVLGDPGRLRQILLNLMSNAVKFTESGSILVKVRPIGWSSGSCLVRTEVIDTGIGIGGDIISKLFMPFTQADGSVTRKYGGTGLGLSICKRLVALMGGTIGVDSTPGAGSIFWLELPMPIPVPMSVPTPLTAVFSDVSHTISSVLVVGAPDLLGNILKDYLTAWGMPFTLAASAEKALTLPGSQVVIIDSRLPDMSSKLLLETMSGAGVTSRFVLLADTEEARDNASLSDFHAILLQPCKQSVLFDAIVAVSARDQVDLSVPPASCTLPGLPLSTVMYKNKKRVLLVEDNVVNQKVAIHLLALYDYEADIANNGQEALDALSSARYSLVLMDCQMPVMDGFEATRLIRQRERSGSVHTTIIAMTANAMQGDRERCLDAGMDDYLAKPFVRGQFSKLLHLYAPPNRQADHMLPALMLNVSRLSDMFGDDMEAQGEILDIFVKSTQPVLDQLGHVIDEGDFAVAGQLAHRLIGSCGNLGAEELVDLAKAVQRAGEAGDRPGLQQRHAEMILAFTRLCGLIIRLKERHERTDH